MNEMSNVKKVIGVVSGKGGVGKSSVTSMLAVQAKRLGYNVAILDADITGPSIPQAFGVRDKVQGSDEQMYPVTSKTGIKIVSINSLLEDTTDPVVWRGPILGNVIEQFWNNVVWEDIDVMFVDMPPGTGDVALTVFQNLPVDGVVIVTSPQQLVSMIVEKAIKMAKMMNIPITGIVENMAYFQCDKCGEKHMIFGTGNTDYIAGKYEIGTVAEIPMNMKIPQAFDKGMIELFEGNWLDEMVKACLDAKNPNKNDKTLTQNQREDCSHDCSSCALDCESKK